MEEGGVQAFVGFQHVMKQLLEQGKGLYHAVNGEILPQHQKHATSILTKYDIVIQLGKQLVRVMREDNATSLRSVKKMISAAKALRRSRTANSKEKNQELQRAIDEFEKVHTDQKSEKKVEADAKVFCDFYEEVTSLIDLLNVGSLQTIRAPSETKRCDKKFWKALRLILAGCVLAAAGVAAIVFSAGTMTPAVIATLGTVGAHVVFAAAGTFATVGGSVLMADSVAALCNLQVAKELKNVTKQDECVSLLLNLKDNFENLADRIHSMVHDGNNAIDIDTVENTAESMETLYSDIGDAINQLGTDLSDFSKAYGMKLRKITLRLNAILATNERTKSLSVCSPMPHTVQQTRRNKTCLRQNLRR
jgi:hypothetical protein